MGQQIVEQPRDEQKDKILLANNCVFSQQQFLGSKGAVALANEELSGIVSDVYAAMEEFAKLEYDKGLSYGLSLSAERDQEQIKYWKDRCEAVENFVSLSNKPYCFEQDVAFNKWQQLKKETSAVTPIELHEQYKKGYKDGFDAGAKEVFQELKLKANE